MNITRELKNVIYEYNFEEKKLYLILPKKEGIDLQLNMTLSKAEMFSLARFLVTVSQKLSQKRRVKNAKS